MKSMASVHEHAKKREFMYAFATDPINFINTLIMNQIRDIKLARSEEAREAEEERHAEYFSQPYTLEVSFNSYTSLQHNDAHRSQFRLWLDSFPQSTQQTLQLPPRTFNLSL